MKLIIHKLFRNGEKHPINANMVVSKSLIGFLMIGTLMAVMQGCAKPRDKSAEELLKDEVIQNEIMEVISNDHQMMMNMMGHMLDNDHAMQMMMGNKEMMQHVMGNRQMVEKMMMQDTTMSHTMMGGMMEMMEKDSAFCNRMTNMMMGNQHMLGAMKDMMDQKGMKMGAGKEQERTHMEMHRHGNTN